MSRTPNEFSLSMPAIRFDVAVYGIIYGNISRVTVESWQYTAVELSTLIYWYVWMENFGFGLACTLGSFAIVRYIHNGVLGAGITSLLIDLEYKDILLNDGMKSWLFPILLIPIHHFLLNPCFYKYFPSMLNCISAGLLLYLVGYTMLVTPGIWGVIISNDTHRYLSCIQIPPRAAMWPDYYIP